MIPEWLLIIFLCTNSILLCIILFATMGGNNSKTGNQIVIYKVLQSIDKTLKRIDDKLEKQDGR